MEVLKNGCLFVECLEDDGELYLVQLPYNVAIELAVENKKRYTIVDSSEVEWA